MSSADDLCVKADIDEPEESGPALLFLIEEGLAAWQSEFFIVGGTVPIQQGIERSMALTENP